MADARDHIVARYARAVLSGEITAGYLVKLACRRHLRDLAHGHKRGLWFDCDAADRVFRFYGLCVHTKGPLAGLPLQLAPWQAFVIGSVCGWKIATDGNPVPKRARASDMEGRASERRYLEAYNEVARKNGKTTMLAPLLLYTASLEGESRAENYCAATKREQAKILYDECQAMVRRAPLLSQLFDAQQGVIKQPQTGSEIRALSKDAHSMDGLNPYVIAVDELHAHKKRDTVDVLKSALGARRNQLVVYITTAGAANQQHSICWEIRSYAVKILQGVFRNDRVFAFIACLDKTSDGAPADDDWRDESTWIKANPNLGVSISIEQLRHDFAHAEANPSAQAEFRRKRCNEWVDALENWIAVAVFDRCDRTFDPAAWVQGEGKGRLPYWGIDLSSVTDLTACALLWPPKAEETMWRAMVRYWVPEQRVQERVRVDRLPYDEWVARGWAEVTPGDMIDQACVRKGMLDLAERFGCKSFGYDKWGGGDAFAVELMNQGLPEGEAVIQGMKSMGHPSKMFEALVGGRHIAFDESEITRWCVTSAALKRDHNNNFMPDKGAAEHSKSKIDGLVAILMALALAQRDREEVRRIDYQAGGLVL